MLRTALPRDHGNRRQGPIQHVISGSFHSGFWCLRLAPGPSPQRRSASSTETGFCASEHFVPMTSFQAADCPRSESFDAKLSKPPALLRPSAEAETIETLGFGAPGACPHPIARCTLDFHRLTVSRGSTASAASGAPTRTRLCVALCIRRPGQPFRADRLYPEPGAPPGLP
jgi:hypothetical protein